MFHQNPKISELNASDQEKQVRISQPMMKNSISECEDQQIIMLSNSGRNPQFQSQNPFNQQQNQSQADDVDIVNNQSLQGHQQSSKTKIRIIERIEKQNTNSIKSLDQTQKITIITLNDISIKIWKLYLNAFYEKEFITTSENPPHISFNKDQQSSQILQEQIDSIFKTLEYKKLAYEISDNELLILLRKLQTNNRLFHKEINIIKSQLKVPYISLDQLAASSQYIYFSIIYTFEQLQKIRFYINSLIIEKLQKVCYKYINFNELLHYSKLDFKQFQENYNCYVIVQDHTVSIIHLSDQQFKSLIQNYINSQQKTEQIRIPNIIIFNQISQIIQEFYQNNPYGKVEFKKEGMIIEVIGLKQFVIEGTYLINAQIDQLSYRLTNQFIQIGQKELQYLQKYKQKEIQEVISKFNAQIDLFQGAQISNEETVVSVKFDDKQIIIKKGNIVNQFCDAIVHIVYSRQKNKIVIKNESHEAILQFGGIAYYNHLNKLNNNTKKIQLSIYRMKDYQSIKAIITIFNLEHNINSEKQVNQIINKIFDIAQNNNLNSISFPIIGGEFIGPEYQNTARIFITQLIKAFNKQSQIKTVKVIETDQSKAEIIHKNLIDLLYPKQVSQWWYQINHSWEKYDDMQINIQLDQEFALYQRNHMLRQLNLNFPINKKPGTHQLDFSSFLITNLSMKTTQVISQHGDQFSFDNKPCEQELNLYIQDQLRNNKMIFQIFYKKYIIEFNNQKIVQLNTETNFKREVIKSGLFPQNPILNNFRIYYEQEKGNISLISLQEQVSSQIQSQLEQILKKEQEIIFWKVINFKQQDLLEIQKTIIKNSVSIEGVMKFGNDVQIKCFKPKVKKIQEFLKECQTNKLIFPSIWDPQENNFASFELQPTSQEFQFIQQLFKKSYDQGKIHKINRIQNILLYEHFQYEKKKLIHEKQLQGQICTDKELKRYLWHGVKGNHPSLVYSGESEAFKINYSNPKNSWGGPALYLADSALYSKTYSFQLQNQNRYVILLCYVVTGKCDFQQPNNALREPSQGFDCVTGKSNDSDIYILYGTSSRRVYPAYEIEFE